MIKRRVALSITGASGSIYAERLLGVLMADVKVERIYLMATESGLKVTEHELSTDLSDGSLRRVLGGDLNLQEKEKIRVFRHDDLFAPIASGSSCPTDMVVVPCSMGTLARIATGVSGNLIERSADVVLKERKNLVIVPRETPMSQIHLENLLKLSRMNVAIVPAMPGFYQKPKTLSESVDFVVGRICEALAVDHECYRAWNSRLR